MSDTEKNNMGMAEGHHHQNNYASGLLWFIIIWIFIVLILWATKPKFVRKKKKHGYGYDKNEEKKGYDKGHGHKNVDLGRVILWAFVVTVIICIFLWVFFYAGSWGNKGSYPAAGRRRGYNY